MECRALRELADSFLSGQLTVETNHEILQHLEGCPNCRAEVAARRALREKLRAALLGAADLVPRTGFAAELTAALRPVQSGTSRRSLLRSLALAAGLAFAASTGLLVRDARSRSRLASLARQAALDHLNCAITFNLAERPITLTEAGRRFGAPYGELAGFEPPALDAPIEVLDRHSCVFGGRRFGHVVFRYRGTVVSLLVTVSAPPASAQLEARDNGPAVASLPAGRFLGFVVADLDRGQILRLAEAFAEPLSRRLV
jgi:hypothetical protein